jgi:CubicO group peptidase (beta-lactamase class C family)
VSIDVKNSDLDFSELHKCIERYVDEGIIPFANSVVLQGNEVIDIKLYGNADLESERPLTSDAIFRMHSSTKLVCSIAAMMLWEEGKFSLDDPLEKYISDFADMKVLKADAQDITNTEAAHDSIRINQILSHTAGFSYGFIEPDSIIDKAYNEKSINPMATESDITLESLCTALGQLPLVYQPGTFWRYSFATDVTARLIEVVSGQRFDEFLKERIFEPLGMHDTDFYVPIEKQDRLTTLYLPADPLDPMSQCVAPMDSQANTTTDKVPSFLSGGGGLMSTLTDFLAFSKMIIGEGQLNGKTLVKPETLSLMKTNQCAEGVGMNFPMWNMPGTTFGLGFALKEQPADDEPQSAIGEYHWGGMAGTHFWWSPKANLAGICMTQRMPGFWHPFSQEFKKLAYKIAGG